MGLNLIHFFEMFFHAEGFCKVTGLKPPQPSTAPVTRGSRLQNFTKYLQQKCLDLYTPQQKIAVDESTVEYKGRLIFKTYNLQKPTKWGLRGYFLAECKSGYICSFEPYFGKQTTESLPWPDQPFTSRIVLHFVDQVSLSFNTKRRLFCN